MQTATLALRAVRTPLSGRDKRAAGRDGPIAGGDDSVANVKNPRRSLQSKNLPHFIGRTSCRYSLADSELGRQRSQVRILSGNDPFLCSNGSARKQLSGESQSFVPKPILQPEHPGVPTASITSHPGRYKSRIAPLTERTAVSTRPLPSSRNEAAQELHLSG